MDLTIVLNSLFGSLIIPLFMTLTVKYKLSGRVKFLLSLLITTVITFLFAFATNGFNPSSVGISLLLTFTLVQSNYQLWYKQTLNQALQDYILGAPKNSVSSEDTKVPESEATDIQLSDTH